jgi:hypothetical protein
MNGNWGIDLGDDGVTPNDFSDEDGGPDRLQNFPIITEVKRKNKGIEVKGTMPGTLNTEVRLEFFSNDTCDPSGYGEGQTYLGSAQIKTNPAGLTTFKILLPPLLTNAAFITATATDPTNNTSEFSQCIMVE